jgi:ATP-dependent RNA helicase DDX56/DBP9
MKRKLDSNDVPSTEEHEGTTPRGSSFDSLNLDPRLLQALTREKFTKPTLVQSEAIPLALEGKDILGMLHYC